MNSSQREGLKCDLKTNLDKQISRRDFLGLSALGACVTAFVLTMIGLLKFPKPALLPDISNIFKIGRPDDFPVGSMKIIEDKKVIIIRDPEGLYAISLICTHLGCIVSKKENGYACPCHGSKFNERGDVIGGPAPRGLRWLEINRHPSGQLMINAKKQVPAGTKFVV